MDKNNNSFWYRFKNDTTFNARVQLIGYVIFIVIVVIYLNFAKVGKEYNYNNVNGSSKMSDTNIVNLFNEIEDNYNYDITVSYKENDVDNTLKYSGKRYKDNMIINRNTEPFYKVSDEYYVKVDDNFKYIDVDTVYELISYKYIELDEVKKLIKKASLEHVDSESNSNFNYIYNLLVKDVVQSYNGNDSVEIKVNVSSGILTFTIDYTNLFKEIYDNISECNIKYVYNKINEVEDFVIIDNE